MNIEVPMVSFVLEETPEYRNWQIQAGGRVHWSSRHEAPECRYHVVVKFGPHELAIVPAIGDNDIIDKSHEQALIADTIMPYIERLFEQK